MAPDQLLSTAGQKRSALDSSRKTTGDVNFNFFTKEDTFSGKDSFRSWLTIHQFENSAECFKMLREKYERILTTQLSTDAVSLYEVNLTVSTALVFGNEHAGVSDEIKAISDGSIVIPQVGMIQSLNISVACAVSLYEAFRQKQAAGHYSKQKISASLYQSLFSQWEKNTT